MHINSVTLTSVEALKECRNAGMDTAVRCGVGAVILTVLMWLIPSFSGGVIGALLTHALAIGVLGSIVGIFAVMIAMWIPAHDELMRRQKAPSPGCVHLRPIVLISRFSSAHLLRVTPPPRAFHR